MATTAEKDYESIPADPEGLDRLLLAFAAAAGIESTDILVTASYRFEDGGSDIRHIEPSAISALVPVAPPISLIVLREPGLGSRLELYIQLHDDHVHIWAAADTMSAAKALVESAIAALGLEPYEAPPQNRVDELQKRLDAVQALQQEDVHLRCFLFFRFGSEDESVAAQVERYLRLQGVEVLTGRSYEPRRVEDKVRARLARTLDFVVYLLTSSGDSAWLRDEVAEARTAQIPVIPLVEEGVQFEQGLFGNVEYIPYSQGHVGDVWISLTEALEFIRALRRRAVGADNGLDPE